MEPGLGAQISRLSFFSLSLYPARAENLYPSAYLGLYAPGSSESWPLWPHGRALVAEPRRNCPCGPSLGRQGWG